MIPAKVALAILAAVLVVVLGSAGPAAADPPGPTDYQTTVEAVDPPNPDVRVTILGGDSFVQLAVEPGAAAEVVGYQGEPYLRFGSDGTVLQNERSPTRWLNEDRYSETEVPAEATADAEPGWVEVARHGTYSWHDHRAHWMATIPPPGTRPGDTVLEGVVPLVVDGEPVAVHVRSVLLEPPTPWAPLAGGAVAVMAVVAVLGAAGGRGSDPVRALAVVTTAWSVAAAGLGWWAYRSVPAETGPSVLLWVPPLVAAGAGLAAWWSAGRPATPRFQTPLLFALAGLELVWWSVTRRTAIIRSLIPSDAPERLDRAVVAGGAIIGVAALIAAVLILVRSRATAPVPA
ncbi:MAG: hypothetical protein ACK5RL_10010 [Acidimicrobiales bacterium]